MIVDFRFPVTIALIGLGISVFMKDEPAFTAGYLMCLIIFVVAAVFAKKE